jgi:hypothetical protein
LKIEIYFQKFKDIIDSNPFVFSSEILFDKRSSYQGFIRADIYLRDNSTLRIREFIDVELQPDRFMYAYQYMSPSGDFIFRYDNTGHHRKLGLSTYPHHKHQTTESNILPSNNPDLRDILEEISQIIRWP